MSVITPVTRNTMLSVLRSPMERPGVIAVVNGATFDGANDFLARGADLTGNANSKVGIIAARIRFRSDGVLQNLLYSAGGFFNFRKRADNKIELTGFDVVPTQRLRVSSNNNVVEADGYVNLLLAWDLATATIQLYVNDSDDAVIVTNNDVALDYTRTNWGIGASDAGVGKADIDYNFLYFNNAETLDFTTEANRRKFFDAGGNPVLGVGDDGSAPTGTAPIIYQAGFYDQWEDNKGTGEGFTVTGALTEPAD